MPTLCYLVGRIPAEYPELVQSAATTLQKVKGLLRTLELPAVLDKPLLQRTVYVSLAALGDASAAEEYINYLVRNPEWDALNRQFA